MKSFFVVDIPDPLFLDSQFSFEQSMATVKSIFHRDHTHSRYDILVGRILSGQRVWGPFFGRKAVLSFGNPSISSPIALEMEQKLEKHVQQKNLASGGQG